jgi:TRAP-type C4-dicarboxylate transport system permease small subunit
MSIVQPDALLRLTRAVNHVFLRLAGAIAALILAFIVYDLMMRNVFNAPTTWVMDVSRFLLVYVFFLALAPALENGSHVSVDILDHYLSPGSRRALRILALALVLIFGAFLLWQLTRTTIEAFEDDTLFPTLVPVKLKYVFWIGPVGMIEFLLTALALLIRALRSPLAAPGATAH